MDNLIRDRIVFAVFVAAVLVLVMIAITVTLVFLIIASQNVGGDKLQDLNEHSGLQWTADFNRGYCATTDHGHIAKVFRTSSGVYRKTMWGWRLTDHMNMAFESGPVNFDNALSAALDCEKESNKEEVIAS